MFWRFVNLKRQFGCAAWLFRGKNYLVNNFTVSITSLSTLLVLYFLQLRCMRVGKMHWMDLSHCQFRPISMRFAKNLCEETIDPKCFWKFAVHNQTEHSTPITAQFMKTKSSRVTSRTTAVFHWKLAKSAKIGRRQNRPKPPQTRPEIPDENPEILQT